MVIVYRSNTGFTREYAEMLGKAEKVKVFRAPEAEERVSPEEEKQYRMLTEGGSCVAFENLGGLRRWLRELA